MSTKVVPTSPVQEEAEAEQQQQQKEEEVKDGENAMLLSSTRTPAPPLPPTQTPQPPKKKEFDKKDTPQVTLEEDTNEKKDNQIDQELDEQNDQSSSAANERRETIAALPITKCCRMFSFVVLMFLLVYFFPILKGTWTHTIKSDFITGNDLQEAISLSDENSIDLFVRIESCKFDVQYVSEFFLTTEGFQQNTAIGIRGDLLFPFTSFGSAKQTLSVDQEKKKITAALSVSSYFSPYLPCYLIMYIKETAILSKYNLIVESIGTNPSTVTFHRDHTYRYSTRYSIGHSNLQNIPKLHSLQIKGKYVYVKSLLNASSPSVMLNINVNSGLINLTSINGASSINITTQSADVELFSQSDSLLVERLIQPHDYYVLAATCIGKIGCYGRQVGENGYNNVSGNNGNGNGNGNSTLFFNNETGAYSNIAMYPTFAAYDTIYQTDTLLDRAPIRLSLISTSGTIYLGTISRDLLAKRHFVLNSGSMLPKFEISSQSQLERITQFINTAPDEDALIIMDVTGPNIYQKKWMYATKEPYLQIEPSWMWIMRYVVSCFYLSCFY